MAEELDIQAIKAILPHRYPMLLVDRIVEFEPGERIVGLKNVSANEPFFAGHFPDYAVMPGVLILEALAQTAAVLMLKDGEEGIIPLFAGADKVRFRRQVVPGDQLRLELQVTRQRGPTCRLQGKAWVGDQVAAQAEIFAVAHKA